jgi:dihydrofolate reductase
MAKLIRSSMTSLDGYTADEHGQFSWFMPDENLLAFINELERPFGTYLYGRRLYEVMVYWETALAEPGQSPAEVEFATIWQAADKVVYSTTLQAASTARTRIERTFDPSAVQAMKDAADRDISVGGSVLGAHAFQAGLVDEVHQLVYPLTLGRGIPFLPERPRLSLELLDERRFDNGVVFLKYQVKSAL